MEECEGVTSYDNESDGDGYYMHGDRTVPLCIHHELRWSQNFAAPGSATILNLNLSNLHLKKPGSPHKTILQTAEYPKKDTSASSPVGGDLLDSVKT
jgi:hypothetical protein